MGAFNFNSKLPVIEETRCRASFCYTLTLLTAECQLRRVLGSGYLSLLSIKPRVFRSRSNWLPTFSVLELPTTTKSHEFISTSPPSHHAAQQLSTRPQPIYCSTINKTTHLRDFCFATTPPLNNFTRTSITRTSITTDIRQRQSSQRPFLSIGRNPHFILRLRSLLFCFFTSQQEYPATRSLSRSRTAWSG